MQSLNIAIIQSDLSWESPKVNYKNFTQKFHQINTKVDLIILPETFSTGFTSNVEQASKSESQSIEWMREQSQRHQTAITGSVICRTNNNQLVNRLLFITPEGNLYYYDKSNLFTLSSNASSKSEASLLTAGTERTIISYKGWKILPTVCFDLRFPLWNYNDLNYDILLNIANWPSLRSQDWKVLLQARAIENQAYTIGCNRVGKASAINLKYSGDSVCIDYQGKILGSLTPYAEGIIINSIQKKPMIDYRNKFPILG
jgi:omega-amidase